MKVQGSIAILCLAALTACGGHHNRPELIRPSTTVANWRSMATTADRAKLRDWREAWMTALGKARTENAAAVAVQGALFDPDRALPGAIPPAGRYRCRVFKLGANGTAMADFTSYPDFECRVDLEGDVSSFYKLTGPQRAVGLILHDSASRAVFLGTLRIGDEARQMQYGRDAQRDIAGIFERVGEKRWRLSVPYPQFESLLDVVELVPASDNPTP